MAKLHYESRRPAEARSQPAVEFVIPLVLLCVGLTTFSVGAFVLDGRGAATSVLLAVLVITAIQTVLGIGVAYLTAALIGASFGELKSAFLKFAAVFVLAGAVAWVVPAGGWLAFFVYFGLLLWLFGLETYEAAVFAVIFALLRFILFLGLYSAMR
jgi:hypothetical protein